MTERYPVRPISPDEFDAFHLVDEHAFHGGPLPAGKRPKVLSRFEFDRSLAAFDGSTPVGVAGAFSFRMRLPGTSAPVAGVSWVSVLPPYRRRGILTRIMHRQLADIRDRGEALAALWASEAGIYGRYGYGRASWHDTFTIRRGEGTLAADLPADAELRLRIAEPGQVRAELAKVYDTVLETRPGFFARNEAWWNRVLDDPEDKRKDASPLRCLLAEDDAGPRGYALYAGVGRWDDDLSLPDGQLDVRELVAADPPASAALWADLLSRDLVTTVRAAIRPVDDPLLFQLADPRRLRPVVTDGLCDPHHRPAHGTIAAPVRVPGGRGPRRARQHPGGKRRPVAAPGRRIRYGRLRAGGRGPGPQPGHHRTGGRLPRRDAPRCAGRRGPGHPAPHRRAGPPVGRHVLGPGPLVPGHLLSPGLPGPPPLVRGPTRP